MKDTLHDAIKKEGNTKAKPNGKKKETSTTWTLPSAGTVVTGAVAGAVVGSFIPAVGTIVGASIGVAFACIFG